MDIKNEDIDIAILPYWMLLENGSVAKVKELISPEHVIATHIPPNFKKSYHKQLNNKFSNITLLTSVEKVHYYIK